MRIYWLPFINYNTVLNNEVRRLLLILRDTGPLINLDFVSCFLRITRAELPLNDSLDMSMLRFLYIERINHKRTISPLRLYLYLKPLYSSLGGSTTLAEAFRKKDIFDDLRWKPLYKWKIFAQRTLVLSDMKTQDSFNRIYNLFLVAS